MQTNRDRNNERNDKPTMVDGLWWLGHLLLTSVAVFFVWFGVALLVASYGLKDPFSFIMTFFAASLIILISLVMTLGFVLRMWWRWQPKRQDNDPEPDGL